MGNKQSGRRESAPGGTDGVPKRKKGKDKRRERPQSTPDVTTQFPDFSFGPRPSVADGSLSGQQRMTKSHSLNPLMGVTEPALISSSLDNRQRADEAYKRAMREVLDVWPEYDPLMHISTPLLVKDAVETLQSVYTRLVNQQDLIRSLSKEKHEIGQELEELKEENNSNFSFMKEKDRAIEELEYNIGILKGNLRKHGLDPKIPERDSYLSDAEKRHSRTVSSGSDPFMESIDSNARLAKILKQSYAAPSYLRPTPLLQAEGRQYGAAVKRSSSLRPVGSQAEAVDNFRSVTELSRKLTEKESELADKDKVIKEKIKIVDDLSDRVNMLQGTLERERKENKALLARLESVSLPSPKSPRSLGPSYNKLGNKFEELQTKASGKILRVLDRCLGPVEDTNKINFLCATFQVSYGKSSSAIDKFYQNIRALLTNPASGEQDPENGYRRPESWDDQTTISKLRKKSQDVPDELMDQIHDYVKNTSDIANLNNIIQSVVDHLGKEFPECTTATMLNHAEYNQFLHECCHLAWTMNISTPPLHISTDMGSGKLDETIHSVHHLGGGYFQRRGSRPVEEMLDYYAWPILYTHRHGDVLHKGKVVLKSHGNDK